MEVNMRRLKDGHHECGEPTIRHMNIVEAIGYVIPNEMQWGANWEWDGCNIVFKTRVFGDLDITTMIGVPEELNALQDVLKAFDKAKTKGVIKLLFTQMGFEYDSESSYSFEDTMVVYEMFKDGHDISHAYELITRRIKMEKQLSKERLEEVHELKKTLDLSPDDGVNCILANFVSI